MAQVELELARDRQQDMLHAAAARRDANLARAHVRLVRQARRAELAERSRAEQARLLRLRIAELEAGL